MRFKLHFFYPAIIFFIITVILLTLPASDLPKSDFFNIPFFDKYVHAGLFFMLVLLFCWPFKYSTFTVGQKRAWFLSITLYGIAYGIIIEFVQKYFIPNRSYDVLDILFDTLGCFAAYYFSRRIFEKRKCAVKK